MDKTEIINKIDQLKAEISALDNKQMAYKILMNSEYGSLGNKASRYFDIRLASAITLSGQMAIKYIEKYLMNHPDMKKYKWEVKYSDTDSLFLSIEYVVEKIKELHPNIQMNDLLNQIVKFTDKIIQPIINDGFASLADYTNTSNRLVMKREKIISDWLIIAKKKYVTSVWDNEGVRYNESKLIVKGLEIVKSSTPKLIKSKLKDAVKIILSDKDRLKSFINETKTYFFELTPDEIAFPRSLNSFNKYIENKTKPEKMTYKKGTPVHSKGAIFFNKWILMNNLSYKYDIINEGDKIKFIYLTTPNPFGTPVISFTKKLPDVFKPYVDYKTMYNKTFLTVLENIQKKIKTQLKIKNEVDITSIF